MANSPQESSGEEPSRATATPQRVILPSREYWGLRAICERMGWRNRKTPVAQLMRTAFPILHRHRAGSFRPLWWTTESLIRWWCLSQVKMTRDALLKRKAALMGARAVDKADPRTDTRGRMKAS